MLSAAELARYARQLALPEVALAGQQRLSDARVLVVGAGGLGSPAALYLAAAGVGTLGIIDDDAVEVSNLHRQIIHATASVGLSKAESARDTLRDLNPHICIRIHRERLSAANARAIIAEYELVVDGSDNFGTRYAVNDACADLGTMWVYGSVERFSGQVAVFGAPGGPCYRCIFPEPPAPGSSLNCEQIGVLGAVPGVIGSLQAVESLKILLGAGTPLDGRLVQWDFLGGAVQEIQIERRSDCVACSGKRAPNPVTRPTAAPLEISPAEVAALLNSRAAPILLDVREPWEWETGIIGDARMLAMDTLPDRLDSLDRASEYIVYCHHGIRSRMAAEWLRAQGYSARSLAGGTDRWSREIDSSIRRY